jgi:hypothetical protein
MNEIWDPAGDEFSDERGRPGPGIAAPGALFKPFKNFSILIVVTRPGKVVEFSSVTGLGLQSIEIDKKDIKSQSMSEPSVGAKVASAFLGG